MRDKNRIVCYGGITGGQFNFAEGNGVINAVQNNYGARKQEVKATEGVIERDKKVEIFL